MRQSGGGGGGGGGFGGGGFGAAVSSAKKAAGQVAPTDSEVSRYVEGAIVEIGVNRGSISDEMFALIKFALIRSLAGQVARDSRGKLVVKTHRAEQPWVTLTDWLREPSNWRAAEAAAAPIAAAAAVATTNVTNVTVYQQRGMTGAQLIAFIAIGAMISVFIVKMIESALPKKKSRNPATKRRRSRR